MTRHLLRSHAYVKSDAALAGVDRICATTTMFSWQRRIRKALVLSIALQYASAFDLWPFKPKRLSGTALVDAGSLGLGNDEQVVAFGDFNGDQL